jgi:mitochondrial fission 1 protein
MDFTSITASMKRTLKKINTEAERLFLPSASSLGLPTSQQEDVIMAESEFARLCAQSCAAEDATSHKREMDSARFRLAWALAHSRNEQHLKRAGHILTDETLNWDEETLTDRDKYYLMAVMYYNRNDYLNCRDNAFVVLRIDPTCTQAQNLRVACEEYLARDGIIGVGGVALIGAVAVGLLASSAGSSRR